MTRRLVLRALGGLAAGAAAWCTCGVVALANESTRQIIALGLPIWTLIPAIGAGIGIAFVATSLPPAALFIPVVLVLPWVGIDLPAILMWQGPISLLVWTLVALCGIPWSRLDVRHLNSPVAAGVAAFAAAWLTVSAGDARRVTGDEPHYLVVTNSVLLDGDLDLASDYQIPRHQSFYAGSLKPPHTVLTPSGREYTFHGLGTSFVVLPAYAAGGVIGARLALSAIAAVGVGLLWAAIRTATGLPGAAWAGICALVLQIPFTAQAGAIYPDGTAAAIVSAALLPIARLERGRPPSAPSLMFVGLALAVLPWLHIRLVPVAVLIAAVLSVRLFRLPQRGIRLLALLALPTGVAILWWASFAAMFETLDPTAPFREKARGSLESLPTGVAGLLVDMEYGLLPYAPAMTFAAAGLVAGYRSCRTISVTCVMLVVSTWMLAASYVWYGGTTTPARFLVPVLPAAAMLIGIWASRATVWTKAWFICAIATGAALLALGARAEDGARLAGDPDGRLTIFDWSTALVGLEAALPSLFRPGATASSELVVALSWALPLVLAYAIFIRMRSSAWSLPDALARSAVVLLVGVAGAATLAWNQRSTPPLTPDRSQLTLLRAAHSRPWLSSGFVKGQLASRQQVLSRIAFAAPGPNPRIALRVADLPPGRYAIEAPTPAPPETLSMELGREAWPLMTWDATQGAAEVTLVAPVHSISVTSSLPESPSRMRLRWLGSVADAAGEPALRVTRYGRWLVYSLDPWSYVETGGFWTAGDRTTRVIVADETGRSDAFHLRLEAGASPVRVRLQRGGWSQGFDLGPGQRHSLTVPSSASHLPLSLHVNGQFRAADAFGDRADGRSLGIWAAITDTAGR